MRHLIKCFSYLLIVDGEIKSCEEFSSKGLKETLDTKKFVSKTSKDNDISNFNEQCDFKFIKLESK